MYPQIDSRTPVEEVIKLLVAQVKELTDDGKRSYETSLAIVVRNRYGGRFARYMGQVRKEVIPAKKPSAVTRHHVSHAFLSSQHASLAMDRIQDH